MKIQRVEVAGAITDCELASSSSSVILHIEHRQPNWWLKGDDIRPLQVFLLCEEARVRAVGLLGESVSEAWPAEIEAAELAEKLRVRGGAMFDLDEAMLLNEVVIPKAWGEELWFSGIESRGVATLGDGGGGEVPLPWLLSAAHQSLGIESQTAPVLLKILAPMAHSVYGDLYFELHEKKREVYVVTSVDREAWPDGAGAIRMGFDPEVLERHADENEFRLAFLSAIQNYERVRRRIDEMQATLREKEGFAADAPVPIDRRLAWDRELPATLLEEERRGREDMNAFSRLHPLREGEVVQIPTKVPHALQHGVRVIEFQTPDYERKIISFAQRVLNQPHWDSAEALEMMRVDMPPQPVPQSLGEVAPGGARLERLTSFPDFEALRLILPPGAEYQFEARERYRLLIGVTGCCEVGTLQLEPEVACLLPPAAASPLRNASVDCEASLLVAKPSR